MTIFYLIYRRGWEFAKIIFPKQNTGKTKTSLPIIAYSIGKPEVNNKQYYYVMTARTVGYIDIWYAHILKPLLLHIGYITHLYNTDI